MLSRFQEVFDAADFHTEIKIVVLTFIKELFLCCSIYGYILFMK